ncbi:uncharacterized protein DUF3140 [Nocardiopsis sp. Huas11]|uniref:DUF3140 domain-containing protein n=1 Tax=Nocardiopsis sp. Huas11 TaxID=2183912 RepID=UPI000EAFFD50|nr:DUF3140 domain-containing protein [Nocardiopsis sp. Huas11]RKS06977.1 uncharacterized protein DUF3140 [Nocardiopsis sp. Huas11]
MAQHDPEVDEVWDDFHSVVNMPGEELRQWLLTDASGEEAFEQPEPDLNVSGRGEEIVAVLNKRKVDVTDSDVRLMGDVARFVHDALAEPRREDPGWRRRLMSVGHDPLRPDSVWPGEDEATT